MPVRTGRYTLAVVALVTAAVCLRGAVALGQHLSRERAAVCRAVTRELFVSGEGEFLREEVPLPTEGRETFFTASVGQRYAKGALLGGAWSGEAERTEVLSRLDYALWRAAEEEREAGLTVTARGDTERELRRSALLLRRGDTAALYPALRALCTAVWKTSAGEAPGEDDGTDGLLFAPESGLFAGDRMVIGTAWRFAAVLSEDAGAQLTVGQTVTLDFAPAAGQKEAETVSLTPGENGTEAVFLCRTDPGDTLRLERAPVRVICGTESGLSVPASALREDEAGFYIWRMDAFGGRRTAVEVVSRQEETVLLRSDGLRKGDRVKTVFRD